MAVLRCGRRSLELSRTRVMGILNTTPDSFSDGGLFIDRDAALRHAQAMVAAGVDIIDVGGESTRPGAEPVSAQQELDRVIPVIEAIVATLDVVISVDTSKPEVMREAVAAGAGMINDVCALRQPGALEAVADTGVPVCLMHMQGEPRTMQAQPRYDDVVGEVRTFLEARMAACEAAGIARGQLLIDPGFGFGKTVAHNLELLRKLANLGEPGVPLLAGLSRKSLIGKLFDVPAEQRMPESVALALIAVQNGASIVRVHDVAETVKAVRMLESALYADLATMPQ